MAADDLLAMIERFETARDELRAVISEAHTAMKDVRLAIADLRRATEEAKQKTAADIAEEISAAVTSALDELAPQMRTHMDRSVEHIMGQFKRLEKRLFVGRDGVDLRDFASPISEADAPGLNPPAATRRTGKTNKRRER